MLIRFFAAITLIFMMLHTRRPPASAAVCQLQRLRHDVTL